MEIYIGVWSILPALLLLLTIWSSFKLKFLKGDREPTGMYFKQFLFTSIALLVSALILYSGIVVTINEKWLFDFVEVSFLEWLIYPAVLVLFAVVGEKFNHKFSS